uniref:uncharacterized protein LOC118151447 n=1 Tax=Callithrix jacchus TaxID=9483 RepID=UPI0023DD1B20|nr:uncharacterized protein LOC118151447 [Callithrix jacchus]
MAREQLYVRVERANCNCCLTTRPKTNLHCVKAEHTEPLGENMENVFMTGAVKEPAKTHQNQDGHESDLWSCSPLHSHQCHESYECHGHLPRKLASGIGAQQAGPSTPNTHGVLRLDHPKEGAWFCSSVMWPPPDSLISWQQAAARTASEPRSRTALAPRGEGVLVMRNGEGVEGPRSERVLRPELRNSEAQGGVRPGVRGWGAGLRFRGGGVVLTGDWVSGSHRAPVRIGAAQRPAVAQSNVLGRPLALCTPRTPAAGSGRGATRTAGDARDARGAGGGGARGPRDLMGSSRRRWIPSPGPRQLLEQARLPGARHGAYWGGPGCSPKLYAAAPHPAVGVTLNPPPCHKDPRVKPCPSLSAPEPCRAFPPFLEALTPPSLPGPGPHARLEGRIPQKGGSGQTLKGLMGIEVGSRCLQTLGELTLPRPNIE